MSEHPLRQWRKKYGITLSCFAKTVESTASSISRVERGVQDPSLNLMSRIAKATKNEVGLQHFLIEWGKNDTP